MPLISINDSGAGDACICETYSIIGDSNERR